MYTDILLRVCEIFLWCIFLYCFSYYHYSVNESCICGVPWRGVQVGRRTAGVVVQRGDAGRRQATGEVHAGLPGQQQQLTDRQTDGQADRRTYIISTIHRHTDGQTDKPVVDVARDAQCCVHTRPELVWKKILQRIPAINPFKPCSHSATLAVSSRKSFN